MSFELQKILESKRALRRDLAARPIGEKLRLLDALRERELAIRAHVTQAAQAEAGAPHDEPEPSAQRPNDR